MIFLTFLDALMPLATIATVLAAAIAQALWSLVSKYKLGNTLLFGWASSRAVTLLWVSIQYDPSPDGTKHQLMMNQMRVFRE